MWISGNADNRYQRADAPDNRYQYPIWRSLRGSRSTSYAVLPPTYPILRNWLVALACGLPSFTCGLNGRQYTLLQSTDQKGEAGWGDCPQALGQTVVITSKQASGAKQAGEGGVGVCRRLSGFDILINTALAHRSRFTGHTVFTCGGFAGQPACMFTYCYGWIFNDWY